MQLFSKIHASNLYLIYGIFSVALMLLLIVPPMQSPDEFDHFRRAYLLSQGDLLLSTPEGKSSGGLIDQQLEKFMLIYNGIPFHPELKVTQTTRQMQKNLTWSKERVFNILPGTGYYFPLIYLPATIGISVGQLLDLKILHTYFLSRTVVFISIILLLGIAFSIHSPPLFLLTIIALPICLFQYVSTSIDGLSVGIAILAISLFFQLYNSSDSHRGKFVLFLSLLGLLSSTRPHLLPVLGLPLLLLTSHSSEKTFRVSSFVAVSTFTIFWILYGLVSTVDLRLTREISTIDAIKYYLMAPREFFDLIWDTTAAKYKDFIRAFIGNLGWGDTVLPAKVYFCWSVLLALSALISINLMEIKKISVKKFFLSPRFFLLLVGATSVILVFFLLLVTWSTTHPVKIIEGIQGRYFILPVIFMAYGFFPTSLPPARWRILTYALFTFPIFLFSVYSLINVLLVRYYIN